MTGNELSKSIHDLSITAFGVLKELFISNSCNTSGFSFTSPSPFSNRFSLNES